MILKVRSIHIISFSGSWDAMCIREYLHNISSTHFCQLTTMLLKDQQGKPKLF